MSVGVKRSVAFAVAGLVWLTGCETTSTRLPDIFSLKADKAANNAEEATGSVGAHAAVGDSGPAVEPVPPFMPSNPNDDLSLGRMNFRQGNYGLAERYFRRAVESGPREAEAWLGLAASYDRLHRFDLADRAYGRLIGLSGRTPEILNNQGYSYMLRGDYVRARTTLRAAQSQDPDSPFIKNNLELLEKSARTRKGIQ